MTVLVTGGAGVVGSYVVRGLVERGDRPLVMDMFVSERFKNEFSHRVEIHVGDLRELSTLLDLCQLNQVTSIIHLAALTGSLSTQQPMVQYRANMEGTMHVLEAARLCSVRRVVMASTRTVYPDFEGTRHGSPQHDPVSESHWTAPERPYEIWKHASERIGDHYRVAHGLEFAALRFATYFAAERAAPTRSGIPRAMSMVHAILHHAALKAPLKLPSGADRAIELIYVRDLAQACISALDAASLPSSVYNIGTGAATSVREFVDLVQAAAASETVIVGPGDDFAVGHYCVLDISRAREDLGYEVRWPLEKAVGDCVDRIRSLQHDTSPLAR